MSINTTLADSFVFVKKYQQAFWRRCRGTVAIFFKPILSSYLYPFYKNKKIFSFYLSHKNSTPIQYQSVSKGVFLEPPCFPKQKI
jgi:hypothetical protein